MRSCNYNKSCEDCFRVACIVSNEVQFKVLIDKEMQQLDIFLSFNHFKQIALTNFSCKFFESCTSSENIFKTFFQIIMCMYFNFFSKDLFVFTESQTNNPELVLFFENILFSVPEDILNFLYVSFN